MKGFFDPLKNPLRRRDPQDRANTPNGSADKWMVREIISYNIDF
jgi:hypothetical protein